MSRRSKDLDYCFKNKTTKYRKQRNTTSFNSEKRRIALGLD